MKGKGAKFEVMDSKVTYSECPEKETAMVAESAADRTEVIPFVSREEAERIFSAQPRMSVEESWRQVDRSLGRLKDSE